MFSTQPRMRISEARKTFNLEQFFLDVEKKVADCSCRYLDALTEVAHEHGIDDETLPVVIKANSSMKAKLLAESQRLNLVS